MFLDQIEAILYEGESTSMRRDRRAIRLDQFGSQRVSRQDSESRTNISNADHTKISGFMTAVTTRLSALECMLASKDSSTAAAVVHNESNRMKPWDDTSPRSPDASSMSKESTTRHHSGNMDGEVANPTGRGSASVESGLAASGEDLTRDNTDATNDVASSSSLTAKEIAELMRQHQDNRLPHDTNSRFNDGGDTESDRFAAANSPLWFDLGPPQSEAATSSTANSDSSCTSTVNAATDHGRRSLIQDTMRVIETDLDEAAGSGTTDADVDIEDQSQIDEPRKSTWVEYVDDTTGLSYFHNPETGEVSWEPPSARPAP
eukprot:SAG31_NODE_6955_length_1836_cov_15.589664_2_plen_318_part_00